MVGGQKCFQYIRMDYGVSQIPFFATFCNTIDTIVCTTRITAKTEFILEAASALQVRGQLYANYC